MRNYWPLQCRVIDTNVRCLIPGSLAYRAFTCLPAWVRSLARHAPASMMMLTPRLPASVPDCLDACLVSLRRTFKCLITVDPNGMPHGQLLYVIDVALIVS